MPVEEIQVGIKYGVRKVNIDTDYRMAMTGAIRKVFAQNPGEFDPRKYLKPAMEAMTQALQAALRGIRHGRQRLADQGRSACRNGHALQGRAAWSRPSPDGALAALRARPTRGQVLLSSIETGLTPRAMADPKQQKPATQLYLVDAGHVDDVGASWAPSEEVLSAGEVACLLLDLVSTDDHAAKKAVKEIARGVAGA